MKIIAKNKKANFNYNILSKIECGIELSGCEIKSIRQGNVNLSDTYAGFKDNELFIYNMHIAPYENGSFSNSEPLRHRKLLLHKQELLKLKLKQKTDHIVLVPTVLYFKNKFVKLEIAVAKPKKLYDKRQDIAKRESQINIKRNLKNANSF